jgi:hypothetical protein
MYSGIVSQENSGILPTVFSSFTVLVGAALLTLSAVLAQPWLISIKPVKPTIFWKTVKLLIFEIVIIYPME